jgi:hypothetical protein
LIELLYVLFMMGDPTDVETGVLRPETPADSGEAGWMTELRDGLTPNVRHMARSPAPR